MNFRTEYRPSRSSLLLEPDDYIIFCGSCFAENIGNRFKKLKFDSQVNPLGITFNPISLFEQLNPTKSTVHSDHFVTNGNIWFHLDFHSQFSNTSRERLEADLKQALHRMHESLKKANWLFLSLGTAYVYEYNQTGTQINNCQKQPAKQFTKRLLTSDEIYQSFNIWLSHIAKLNSSLKIVLTLSPVRHLKDGMEENQVSKSILRYFIHTAVNANSQISYFPSYEIMLDDLRDYRFYAADLVHPNDQAIDYIWNKLDETYFSSDSRDFIRKIKKINTFLSHKPFEPESEIYQNHLLKIKNEIIQFPYERDWSKEIELINNRQSPL